MTRKLDKRVRIGLGY